MQLAIIGPGTIATASHVPALAASPHFTLVASMGPAPADYGVPHVADMAALGDLGVQAVAICTPPGPRVALAAAALARGWHVLLEKPPAVRSADQAGLVPAPGQVLFTAWHSRFAAAVPAAQQLLAGRRVTHVAGVWEEDMAKWHPGQDWLWQAGGFGVLDMGINALSLLTHLLPGPLQMQAAKWQPHVTAMPQAGRLQMLAEGGCRVDLALDGAAPEDRWELAFTLEGGDTLRLAQGGAALWWNDAPVPVPHVAEYAGVYAHFAALVAAGRAEVDVAPLQLAEAALAMGGAG
ncbi:MAG: Gfo/Idh/MocA family oxidoreductase [Sphingomonadales bacterium]